MFVCSNIVFALHLSVFELFISFLFLHFDRGLESLSHLLATNFLVSATPCITHDPSQGKSIIAEPLVHVFICIRRASHCAPRDN